MAHRQSSAAWRLSGAGQRRGTVMVAAIICLLLVSLLLGALLKRAILGRRQIRQQENRAQSVWLAEAGLQRAARRLSADPEYVGETWQINPADLDGTHTAVIIIEVQTPDDDPDERLVDVEARFPSGMARFAKRSRRVRMPVKADQ